MQFPEWVDSKKDDTERAAARLSYMMTTIATQRTGRGTLRAFAKLVDIDHSTLAYSLKRGSCTPAVALRIEDKLGRETACNEHFRNPLEIT
jgi:hypothetical protein